MAQVELRVVDDALDQASLADCTRALRQLLRGSDLDASLAQRHGETPENARSGGAIEVGVVLLQTAVETGALKYAIDLVRGWLGRTEVADVEITLGDKRLLLKEATPAERQQLIEHYIAATSKTD